MLKTLLRSLRRIICLQEVKALSILSQRANILRHLKDTRLSILVIMDDMALDNILAIFISTRTILLKKADEEGELSTFGKEVYSKVRLLYNEANGREGDLTSIGAKQYKGIAARMYNNFPEIFAGKQTCIDARSTVVIRSILSMENALQQLSALNPKLSIRHDATEHDMYFMNYSNNEVDSIRLATKKMQRRMYAKNIKYERLMRKLFVNEGYWHDSIDARKLTIYLFKLATHVQNSEIKKSIELLSLFTPQELYDQWVVNNAMWYIKYANASQSNQAMPKIQKNLLHQIINDADSCLKLPYPSASLRY